MKSFLKPLVLMLLLTENKYLTYHRLISRASPAYRPTVLSIRNAACLPSFELIVSSILINLRYLFLGHLIEVDCAIHAK